MANPLTLEFWTKEEALLWESLEGLVMLALLQGMDTAATLLPPALQPLINWDFTNQSALQFLQQYRVSTIGGISDTTRDQTVRAIQNWMSNGDPLPSLVNQLTPIYGNTRAQQIAITEVTRVFAQGNMMLWESTGVVSGKRWRTARDERVCPFCAPLDGQVVELNSEFTLSPQQMAASDAMRQLLGDRFSPEAALQRAGRMLNNVGTRAIAPPYHVRCRCWLQPFVSEELLRQSIGAELAQSFFADVKAGKFEVAHA